MNSIKVIREFVKKSGAKVQTGGISDALLSRFQSNPDLNEAAARAVEVHKVLQKKYPEILAQDEAKAITTIQSGFMQFYDANVRVFSR